MRMHRSCLRKKVASQQSITFMHSNFSRGRRFRQENTSNFYNTIRNITQLASAILLILDYGHAIDQDTIIRPSTFSSMDESQNNYHRHLRTLREFSNLQRIRNLDSEATIPPSEYGSDFSSTITTSLSYAPTSAMVDEAFIESAQTSSPTPVPETNPPTLLLETYQPSLSGYQTSANPSSEMNTLPPSPMVLMSREGETESTITPTNPVTEIELLDESSVPISAQQEQATSSCSASSECVSLSGDCCPTLEGNFLLCCFSGVPSLAPTTVVPTISPQPTTTRFPTKMPSRTPTLAPTLQPSVAPATFTPTNTPTFAPTEGPTLAPTEGPTPEPSNRPTATPSLTPVSYPTSTAPESSPSVAPSDSTPPTPAITTFVPTSEGTAIPSNVPTVELSEAPTKVSKETETPSNAEISKETGSPSNAITGLSSKVPTKEFEFEMTKLRTANVQMELKTSSRRLQETASNTKSVSEDCTYLWGNYVRDRTVEEVDSIVKVYESLDVNFFNISSLINEKAVLFTYDVIIEIRSAVSSHDSSRYIEGPFDSNKEKEEFITFLKESSCKEFARVTDIIVRTNSNVVTPIETDNTPSEKSSKTLLIAGLSGGIAGILIITALFIFIRTRKGEKAKEYDDEFNGPLFTPSDEIRQEYVSEIGLNGPDDVSTLGDPIPAGVSRFGEEVSTLESNAVDYDYKQAYLEVGSSFGASHFTNEQNDGIETVNESNFDFSSKNTRRSAKTIQDDYIAKQYIAEEQFEVLAPPGVLGLIVEANKDDGCPAIHGVKPESVLAGVVKEGDRIVSIDGEDVTLMTANEASRLIASKKDELIRKFVFCRAVS